ncbi:MAG: glycoside hydrolase family 31 protein [Oscillospiraceae bacterium]|jgi:alpha-glucosidase (family GH31 glycosyl hydrolase)|nr:glycoside hydrolase family 31 protein [Oscillospiraceae bacterium]
MRQFSYGSFRVTVLTDTLFRVEKGTFCDAKTQTVFARDFDTAQAVCFKKGGVLQIKTAKCRLNINKKSGRVKCIRLEDGRVVRNFKKGNLGGTRRTLDFTFGAVSVGSGVISRGGVAVLDDSASLTLNDNGETIAPRAGKCSDLYYFAYGDDYRGALRDFYKLTGDVPMIPRFALGNWWSRYKAYTQEEYVALMDRLAAEGIPICVATVDMDWHWVNLRRFADEETSKKGIYPSGWTGYSWNTDLFPDYRAFLRDLKTRNLRVTLNLHPADGVRAFEDVYPAMAEAMGVDPASKKTIAFDLINPNFRKAYFEVLHHPYEDEGVDFWWIDWQQGKKSAVKGLDPLWMLNHYHYLDNMRRKGKNGLVLSRYAGPGSHRYPLGFSGDTAINWNVLRFQPKFTAMSANAGYGWWSHDIGGHHFGKKEDELYLRWLQFGVYNPILRLHSTSNEFNGKEPWKCRADVRQWAGDYLRLRHRMIPYLYSMAHRASRDGIALCEPLYYLYPEERDAYTYRNSYFFGTELLAAPITEKTDDVTNRAGVTLWLPQGRWTDIFTNQIYQGGRVVTVHRGLENIPVFAKEGAILPLAPESTDNNCAPPRTLHLHVWRGTNHFTLFEDEGETTFAIQEDQEENGRVRLEINGRKRTYVLRMRDIVNAARVTINGETVPFSEKIAFSGEAVEVVFAGITPLRNQATREALIDLISSFSMGTNRKKRNYNALLDDFSKPIKGAKAVKGAMREILLLDDH